ncbi:MAG TPA: hypothetical protein VFX48_02500 [Saprospiraceae bacterium]|nr:hypothetical protein [Saprospiraceae bacterium]
MKKLFFGLVSLLAVLGWSCSESHDDLAYEYHAHILLPDSTLKTFNDSMPIKVDFESHTGAPVHHIQLRIFNKSSLVEVYKKPEQEHVHAVSGEYLFQDVVLLNAANGFSPGSNWILEARVWGEEDGEEESVSTLEFQIKP